MKRVSFLLATLCFSLLVHAQTDSLPKKENKQADTVRVGNVTIITNKDDSASDRRKKRWHSSKKKKNITTNWFVPDIGFTNYTDNTDYSSAEAQVFAPGATKDWFKLRPQKSVNVNIWVFAQEVNLIKHIVNLKYALGIEMNNYHYKEEIRFEKNPTLVYKDDIIYRKNKLAADYVTLPLLLNFNFTPKAVACKEIGLSVGASAGYLYSARQKFISDETGKQKVRNDFELRPFKISYVAELKLGYVTLYGSMATQSMFEKGLDQTPFAMGLRFNHL